MKKKLKVVAKAKPTKEAPAWNVWPERRGAPGRFDGPSAAGIDRFVIGRYMRTLDRWPLGREKRTAQDGLRYGAKTVELVGLLDAAALSALARDARTVLRKIPKTYVPGKKGQLAIP